MNKSKVVIIDYGVGNLLSVQRGFEHCGAEVILTADPEEIIAAERVVLPGVGSFGNAMKALEQLGLVSPIREIFYRKTPLLAICLGMQLLLDESEEFGFNTGLGLIPGRVIKVPSNTISGETQKIPHVGWGALKPSSALSGWNGTLLQNNVPNEEVYFVHSFMTVPLDHRHRLAECIYGGHQIAAAIRRDQITGCQFHPEKSGRVGLKILREFILQ